MRKAVTALSGLLGLLFLVAAAGVATTFVADDAAAQVYRQFTGRIDKIDDDKLIVDNRQGDKVAFNRVPDTSVEGQDKASWDDLSKGDWVTVDWLFMDKPRKAYKIQVIPPREEE